MDKSSLYFIAIANDQKLYTFFLCSNGCANCSFPNNCSACENGFILKDFYCYPQPTQCVGNVVLKNNICAEYCHKKCKTCNQTRTDCYECADFYKRDQNGECVLKNEVLSLLEKVRPFLNFIKRRGLKAMFLAIDDLWLYNYHSHQYDGTALTIFETI